MILLFSIVVPKINKSGILWEICSIVVGSNVSGKRDCGKNV